MPLALCLLYCVVYRYLDDAFRRLPTSNQSRVSARRCAFSNTPTHTHPAWAALNFPKIITGPRVCRPLTLLVIVWFVGGLSLACSFSNLILSAGDAEEKTAL